MTPYAWRGPLVDTLRGRYEGQVAAEGTPSDRANRRVARSGERAPATTKVRAGPEPEVDAATPPAVPAGVSPLIHRSGPVNGRRRDAACRLVARRPAHTWFLVCLISVPPLSGLCARCVTPPFHPFTLF